MKNKDKDDLTTTLSNSVGYLLSQSARIYRNRLSKALIPLGLSLYEYACLRLISFNVPISQGNLGEKYGIDRTTMVGIIDQLEKRELVLRERSAADRRSYRLLLTPKGRKMATRAKRIVTNEQKYFLNALSEKEWTQMRSNLLKLIDREGQGKKI
jgi:DNA-binding MarR family transcriptional regulator